MMRAFPLLLVCAAVALVATADEEPIPLGAFNSVLAIKQILDHEGSSSELGEGVEGNAKAAEGLRAAFALMTENELTADQDLGESNYATQADCFPKIQVRQPVLVAKTIKTVVQYLKGLKQDHMALTKDQLAQARTWYLQTTAIILGRFAYDDREAEQAAKGAKGFEALKPRAEAVKQTMDKVDATNHLLHMGVGTKWMDEKGTDVIQALTKTARLARFLSEIEEARKEKIEGLGQTVSESGKLKTQQADILAAINRLLGDVENGDPITGGTTHAQNAAANKDTPEEKKLMGHLMQSANKEDKAKIISAAGDVANNKIKHVIAKAHQDMKAEEDKITLAKKPVKNLTPAKAVKTDKEVTVLPEAVIVKRSDVVAPISLLHSQVENAVSSSLNAVMKLFQHRKAAHKRLSLKDLKSVNKRLRGLTAHLMQRYANPDEERPFALKVPMAHALTMPLKKAAWMRKQSTIEKEEAANTVYHSKHGRAPVHVGLTMPLHHAKKALQPDTIPLPAPPTPKKVQRDPVTQFVWSTLKSKGVKAVKKARSLATLLEKGVKLRTNGFLRFATPAQ